MKVSALGAKAGCRAPHGARGLKLFWYRGFIFFGGRAPHGARGLKLAPCMGGHESRKSRPTRGAWIETEDDILGELIAAGRAPHGARGLKLTFPLPIMT